MPLRLYSSKYNDAGYASNAWVINSEWLYCLYWCSGVTTVTTNWPHKLPNRSSPMWHMVSHIKYFMNCVIQKLVIVTYNKKAWFICCKISLKDT